MGLPPWGCTPQSHPNDWLDTGLDALSRDMDSSAQNSCVIWDASSAATNKPALVLPMLPSSVPWTPIRSVREKNPFTSGLFRQRGRGLFIKQK